MCWQSYDFCFIPPYQVPVKDLNATNSFAFEGVVLGIEFYLFVSHGGMKRQRVHV